MPLQILAYSPELCAVRSPGNLLGHTLGAPPPPLERLTGERAKLQELCRRRMEQQTIDTLMNTRAEGNVVPSRLRSGCAPDHLETGAALSRLSEPT